MSHQDSPQNRPGVADSVPGFPGPELDSLLERLDEATGMLEQEGAWPEDQFKLLAEYGVLGWVVPRQYGGSEISPVELTRGYEVLAAACLPTTFVLTQRNGACQRIAGSENDELKEALLSELCAGRIFATVGVSHLTTSRQHVREPAVRVELTEQSLRLDGKVPWVTGAAFADYVVTGGTCADGLQVLVALPTDRDGVQCEKPPKLLALNASQTGSVRLDSVEIERRHLIAGPVDGVMKRGQGGGAGSLTTSALALGTASAAIARLKEEAERRDDLGEIVAPLEADHAAIVAEMYATLQGDYSPDEAASRVESIRKRANSLVLRASQAYLAASKGAGFVVGHPAERFVRQAMFFLVWSCPQPILTAALREFACVVEN